MAGQDFELMRERLLPLLERIVVEDHAALHRDALGERWSPPVAYRFMRYENPDPVGQLLLATRRLGEERTLAGVPDESPLELDRLDEATRVARRLGYGGQPRA